MAGRTVSKLKYYLRLGMSGDLSVILGDIHRRMWSEDREYRLSRDLVATFSAPRAQITITVQPLTAELATIVFNTDGLGQLERRELEDRRRLWQAHIGMAHVALDPAGNPCFIAWTIPASETDHLHRLYPGYAQLRPDELLLIGAWTIPCARGQHIMAEAVSRMMTAGARPEHRQAIAFVKVDNERSWRGCCSAGFRMSTEQVTTWRFGRKRVRSLAASTTSPSLGTRAS